MDWILGGVVVGVRRYPVQPSASDGCVAQAGFCTLSGFQVIAVAQQQDVNVDWESGERRFPRAGSGEDANTANRARDGLRGGEETMHAFTLFARCILTSNE